MGFLRVDSGEDGISHQKRLDKTQGFQKEHTCIRYVQGLGLLDVHQLHTGHTTPALEREGAGSFGVGILSGQDMEEGEGYSVNTQLIQIDAVVGEFQLFQLSRHDFLVRHAGLSS